MRNHGAQPKDHYRFTGGNVRLEPLPAGVGPEMCHPVPLYHQEGFRGVGDPAGRLAAADAPGDLICLLVFGQHGPRSLRRRQWAARR